MQADSQPRYPPARVRHGKRFNRSPWPGGQGNALDEYFSVPFTFTVFLPPTSIILSVPTTDSLTLATTPTLSSLSTTPTPTTLVSSDTTTSSSTPPTTSASSTPLTTTTSSSSTSPTSTTNSGSATGAATANITAAPALSPGAIAGIVIVVLLIFLAGIIIALKKQALNNMFKARGWSVRRSPSTSFLWIEPGDKSKSNLTPYPRTTATRVNPRTGVPSAASMTFAAAPGSQHTTSTTALVSPVPSQAPEDTTSPTPLSSAPPAQEALQVPESAVVVLTFIPTLPDELPIVSRETIRILVLYDDGWAYCSNARGEAGMVPLECLAWRGLPRGLGRHARNSSLGPFPGTLVGES